LDPLSPTVHSDFAVNLAYRGLDEQFEKESARVLEEEPATVRLHWFRTMTRGIAGNWQGAVEAAESALRYLPEDPATLGFAASAYTNAGYTARGDELRGKLEFLSQIRYVPPMTLAFAHDVPGGADAFFQWTEQAIAERDPISRVLRFMPRVQHFESDARFDVLLQKLGLSDEDVAKASAVDLAG
jgi:hypothetical protein